MPMVWTPSAVVIRCARSWNQLQDDGAGPGVFQGAGVPHQALGRGPSSPSALGDHQAVDGLRGQAQVAEDGDALSTRAVTVGAKALPSSLTAWAPPLASGARRSAVPAHDRWCSSHEREVSHDQGAGHCPGHRRVWCTTSSIVTGTVESKQPHHAQAVPHQQDVHPRRRRRGAPWGRRRQSAS